MGTPLDGPKGPREKTKKGLLYLSQKTAIPLIPVGIAYSKKWILEKTWDKFQIPKPFSIVRVILGEPIEIKEENNLDEFTEIVENKVQELNNIANKVDKKFEQLYKRCYVD